MTVCPLCKTEKVQVERPRIYVYYGPTISNYGPPGFLYQAFKRFEGVETYLFECRGNPDNHGHADLKLFVDYGEDLFEWADWIPSRPRAYWVSDTHISENSWTFRRDKAKKMDRVYCSIWSDVERLAPHLAQKPAWVPYAADAALWAPSDVPIKYDLGFVGHYGNYPARLQFIHDLMDEYQESMHLAFTELYFEDAVKFLAECRIVVNHCQGDSTNMRTFEGMAMGKPVLQPATGDLPLLGFQDGIHLITYRTTDEAMDKLAYYLDRPADLARIGGNAREAILNGHTYCHRAQAMSQGLIPDDKDLIRTTALKPIWKE